MKKTFALIASLSVLSIVALAAPPKGKKPVKASTKVADVWTCPMTGEAIKDHSKESGTPVTVGKYRVHFCCGGCPESFAKLSPKQKQEKAAAAAKKETTKKA